MSVISFRFISTRKRNEMEDLKGSLNEITSLEFFLNFLKKKNLFLFGKTSVGKTVEKEGAVREE